MTSRLWWKKHRSGRNGNKCDEKVERSSGEKKVSNCHSLKMAGKERAR